MLFKDFTRENMLDSCTYHITIHTDLKKYLIIFHSKHFALSYFLMNIAFNMPPLLSQEAKEVRSNMCHLMLLWSIFPHFSPSKVTKMAPFLLSRLVHSSILLL